MALRAYGWNALIALLARLPQGALSRATGRLADLRIPRPLRAPLLGAFARAAGIDTSEAEHAPAEYDSLDAFFVRRLRPGARTWPADPDTVTSPVDGIIGPSGRIEDGHIIQAKRRTYTVADLLDDEDVASRCEGGAFLTIYLSPRHYHRVHAPLAGSVRRVRHVPGALLPVNPPAMERVPGLFPHNERLICPLESGLGEVSVVAVGAYNVGRITVAFDDAIRTNRKGAARATHTYDPPVALERGDELLAFHLGSTVVLVFERERVRLMEPLAVGQEIRLGQPIGRPWHGGITTA